LNLYCRLHNLGHYHQDKKKSKEEDKKEDKKDDMKSDGGGDHGGGDKKDDGKGKVRGTGNLKLRYCQRILIHLDL
jgi:hypothetical protein